MTDEEKRIVEWLRASPIQSDDENVALLIDHIGNGWALDFAERIERGDHMKGINNG